MTKMWNQTQLVGIGVLLFVCLTGCTAQKPKASVAQKEDALRSLRDSGVISGDEYQQRLAEIHGSGAVSSAKPGGAGSVWKMERFSDKQRVQVLPDGHWEEIPSLSMLVPKGWQTKVQVRGGFDCSATTGRLSLVTADPENKGMLIVVAKPATFWSPNRNVAMQRQAESQRWHEDCTVRPPQPLEEVLKELAEKMVPGFRVESVGPYDEANRKLAPSVAEANQQMGSSGSHLQLMAMRLQASGTLGGAPTAVRVLGIQTIRTMSSQQGQIVIDNEPMLAVEFTPADGAEAHFRLLDAMLDSVQVSPEWTAYNGSIAENDLRIKAQTQQNVARSYAQMQQDNANAAAQQASIRRDAANYSSHVISSVHASQSAALSHSSQQFAMYMGDQAQYKDPSTGQVFQGSSNYSHVWASATGNTNEFIMTDSPSYNPNGNAGSAGWTEMQQVH